MFLNLMILSHVSWFIPGEVAEFQFLLDSLHPRILLRVIVISFSRRTQRQVFCFVKLIATVMWILQGGSRAWDTWRRKWSTIIYHWQPMIHSFWCVARQPCCRTLVNQALISWRTPWNNDSLTSRIPFEPARCQRCYNSFCTYFLVTFCPSWLRVSHIGTVHS